MLTTNQKKKVFSLFPIEEYTISGDRTNYRYKNKVIIRELAHTGNCYIWGKDIKEYSREYGVDPRGWINIKNYSEEQIQSLLHKVINYRDKLTKKEI